MQRSKRQVRWSMTLIAALALASGGVLAWNMTQGAEDREPSPPPRELAQGGVLELLAARPFRVEEPYVHHYRAERPLVTEGWLLALRVDRDLARMRQGFMPVLYGAGQTLERFNPGHTDGVIVALLPRLIDQPMVGERLWFGDAELPERLDAFALRAQEERAQQARIQPIEQEAWDAARAAGGFLLEVPERIDLEEAAAELVRDVAPGDRAWAESILIPR